MEQQRYEGKLTITPLSNVTLLGSYTKINQKDIGNSFGTIYDLVGLDSTYRRFGCSLVPLLANPWRDTQPHRRGGSGREPFGPGGAHAFFG